jgi:hypothetical protein
MIALISKFMERVHGAMSSQMHNYGVLVTLGIWAVAVVSTLLWPQQTRLEMAKDVGIVVLGWMGIVATGHVTKAINGVEGGSRRPEGAP